MQLKSSTKNYRIVKLKSSDITDNLLDFFYDCGHVLNHLYDTNHDVTCVDYRYHADANHLWICLRNNRPVGFLLALNTHSFFNPSVKSLTQQIFFAVPKTRASYLLMKELIDFGRSNGKHIITMVGLATNIKPETLKRLGFKYAETVFRMEV